MPKSRQPREIWRITRLKVWTRDGGRCQSPLEAPVCQGKPRIDFDKAHIDHIISGKLGSNALDNLRTLCPMCHALRADKRHAALLAKMLRANLLPDNWHQFVWE